MTQRVLVALSLLVIAVSIGGALWQSKKIAQREASKTVLDPVAENPDPSPTPSDSTPKLAQIDGAPSNALPESSTSPMRPTGQPTLQPTVQPTLQILPVQNPSEPLLPGGLQNALEIPAGSALTSTADGILRYRAVLSFVNDIKIVAQTDGIILDLLVDEGSVVSKDTTMIQIDNRLANAEKEVAVKELESAKLKAEDESQIKFSAASYEVATSVLNRSQDLYVKGVEPQDDWEKKRLEKVKAGFQIDVSKREQMINQAAVGINEAKLNASLVQLELRTIKAPFSGVVASMQKERFEWVKAGEEILRLVSLEKFRVKGTVRIADSPNTLEGAKAKVIIPVGAGQVEQIDGLVGFVSPESQGSGARNDGTQEYTVWVEIPNQIVNGKYLFRGTMDAIVEITPNR